MNQHTEEGERDQTETPGQTKPKTRSHTGVVVQYLHQVQVMVWLD